MQKSIRSFVLVTLVALSTASAHAGVMGTDPRPTTRVIASPTITQTLLHFFGF